MRARLVEIAADGLGRDHGDDLLSPRAAGAGEDQAAHVLRPEMGRLLVREEDEAERSGGARVFGERGEVLGEVEDGRDSGAVVVRGGALHDRVVVRADDDDLVGKRAPGEIDPDVGALDGADGIGLAIHAAPELLEA